ALARADGGPRAPAPGARGAGRRPSAGDARGLLPPARPHRDGQGAADARVPGPRRARRAAAARPRGAREPRRRGARPARRLSRAPQLGARRRVVALPAGAHGGRVAPGGDDQALGRRVKVLVLVTRFPVPPWRGDQVRAFHHLRLLAPRHAITCCALVLRPPPPEARATLAAMGVRLEVVRLGLLGVAPALARVLAGDRRALQLLLYHRRRPRAAVARLVAAAGFAVVHAQLVRALPSLDLGARPRPVLDLVDALSQNIARRAAATAGPAGRLLAWEAARLARAEAAAVASGAPCLVVSAAERAALPASDRGDVRVVPNGVDTAAFAYREDGRAAARLVFGGDLRHLSD